MFNLKKRLIKKEQAIAFRAIVFSLLAYSPAMFLLKSLLGDLLEKNTTSAFHVDHTLLLRLRKLAVLANPCPARLKGNKVP